MKFYFKTLMFMFIFVFVFVFVFVMWISIAIAISMWIAILPLGECQTLPVVILHGYSASATNMDQVQTYLESYNLTVYNIEIGNGVLDSMFMPMWKQLAVFNRQIKSIDGDLSPGFNMVCMSQGALICRGYIEMYNNPPVRRFISWVGPHGGMYIPGLEFPHIYETWSQEHNSFSNYWRDPYRLEDYKTLAHYLPVINLDRTNAEGWSSPRRLDVLDQLVLIWSPEDDVLSPPSSGIFGHYEVVDDLPIVTSLFETSWYWEDRLGLRTLNDTGRLHMLETQCEHQQHVDPSCFPQLESLTIPWLTT